MASQYNIQKDIEQHFKPNKNDPYLKDMMIKKFDNFIADLIRNNQLDDFIQYINDERSIMKSTNERFPIDDNSVKKMFNYKQKNRKKFENLFTS